MLPPRLLNYIKTLWCVLALFGFGYFAIRFRASFIQYFTILSYSHIALSIFCIICGKIVLSGQIQLSLSRVNQPLTWLESLRIYILSDSSKYIPGGIWSTASRIGFYRKRQINYKATAIAMLWENSVLVISAIAIGSIAYCLLLIMQHTIPSSLARLTISCILLLWLFSHALLCKLSKLPPLKLVKQFTQLILPLGLARIFYSLSLLCLLPTTAHVVISLLICIIAITLGKTIGMLAFFSPGGIGVREFLIYTVLRLGINSHFSIQTAIASRISFFIAEILLFLVVLLISFFCTHITQQMRHDRRH